MKLGLKCIVLPNGGMPGIPIPHVRVICKNGKIASIFAFNGIPFIIIGNAIYRITHEEGGIVNGKPVSVLITPKIGFVENPKDLLGIVKNITVHIPQQDLSRSPVYPLFSLPRVTIMPKDNQGTFYRMGSRRNGFYVEQTGGKKIKGKLIDVRFPIYVGGSFSFAYIPESNSCRRKRNNVETVITIYVETDPHLL